MSVSIKYKGTEIASASTEVTKTIKTAGKYCEADILVENTPDGGDSPVINPLSVTANGTYTAPSGVDGYSPINVNVPQGGDGVETSEVLATSYVQYDSFSDFVNEYSAYIPKTGNCLTRISFLNNTSNTRAGVVSYCINDTLAPSPFYVLVNRVGNNWVTSSYGVDVYAGATIRFEVVRFD